MELISQNHCSLCLYIFNKCFMNNKIIKGKIHNNDVKKKKKKKKKKKNDVKKKKKKHNINPMIHYNHIEIFPKEVCDEMSFHRY